MRHRRVFISAVKRFDRRNVDSRYFLAEEFQRHAWSADVAHVKSEAVYTYKSVSYERIPAAHHTILMGKEL